MPIQYRSQLEEHRAVRERAGLFDISHMGVVDIDGAGARDYLRRLLANDVARLKGAGRALYTCLLNEQGGVLDDLIVTLRGDGGYRVVVNAATRDSDLAWMQRQAAGHTVALSPRPELAMLAVQGPQAVALALGTLPAPLRDEVAALKPFQAAEHGDWFVSRTGYTGEDGLEIVLPAEAAPELWQRLLEAGFEPCGLGARDTLRLEAGLNLYGQDMDDTVTPLESNLGWTVAWEPAERDFIGRDALQIQRDQGVPRRLIGLVLEQRGVMRAHQPVSDGEHAGEITSGSYSPMLGASIGLARVPADFGDHCHVRIRDRELPARVVRPPFVRNGRVRV
jgi:aminomethyltransferase